jgi:hypothetical protein
LGLIAGDSLGEEEVMRMFLEDRQENGDFISKVADMVLRRNGTGLDAVEATTYQENAADVSCANHVYALSPPNKNHVYAIVTLATDKTVECSSGKMLGVRLLEIWCPLTAA